MTPQAVGTDSLLPALRVQLRVVNALLMREIITRYGRHNIGVLWLFAEPMMFTLGIVAMWSATHTLHTTTLPIVTFSLTGYSCVLLWRNAATRCSKAIEPNRSLLFHRNVRVLDLLLARLILEFSGATLSFFLLGLLFCFMGWSEPPADPFLLLQGWLLLGWFAFAMGGIVGAISERSETMERLWHAFTYLMFPLSGAVFMVDWLPPGVRALALWVPMVNATEMVRGGYLGSLVTTHYDTTYLITVNLVLSVVGLVMVRQAALRVEGE